MDVVAAAHGKRAADRHGPHRTIGEVDGRIGARQHVHQAADRAGAGQNVVLRVAVGDACHHVARPVAVDLQGAVVDPGRAGVIPAAAGLHEPARTPLFPAHDAAIDRAPDRERSVGDVDGTTHSPHGDGPGTEIQVGAADEIDAERSGVRTPRNRVVGRDRQRRSGRVVELRIAAENVRLERERPGAERVGVGDVEPRCSLAGAVQYAAREAVGAGERDDCAGAEHEGRSGSRARDRANEVGVANRRDRRVAGRTEGQPVSVEVHGPEHRDRAGRGVVPDAAVGQPQQDLPIRVADRDRAGAGKEVDLVTKLTSTVAIERQRLRARRRSLEYGRALVIEIHRADGRRAAELDRRAADHARLIEERRVARAGRRRRRAARHRVRRPVGRTRPECGGRGVPIQRGRRGRRRGCQN